MGPIEVSGKQQEPKIICLTRTRVGPVAQGGTDARMGAKNKDTRKQQPTVIAVRPVRPPSAIPAPLSIKAVTGEQPKRDPIEMHIASVQYAIVDRGKSPSSFTTPQNLAIEYRVAVQSMMSTYKKVTSASANCFALCPAIFHCCAARIPLIGWKETIGLKNSNRSFPATVSGKYENVVSRLHRFQEGFLVRKVKWAVLTARRL